MTPTRPAFTIDVPAPEDAPALARIHTRGWRAAYGHLLSGEQWFGQSAIDRRTVQWAEWIAPRSGATPERVLRIGRGPGGAPVGLVGSFAPRDTPPVRDVELSLLYIDQDRYGTGLGRALVEAAIGEAPASLWVAEDNPRARRFYEKLGFAPDGARHVEQRLEGLVEIRMVR